MSEEKYYSSECPKCGANVEISINNNEILIRKDCKCEIDIMELIK